MQAVADAIVDAALPSIAEAFLARCPLGAEERNSLQDLIWQRRPSPEIPKRFRRELAESIEAMPLYLDHSGFDRLLDSLWILDDPWDVISPAPRSLRARIDRHVYRNPDDWTILYLFEQLGALDASHQRFVRFIEGLASSNVRPDEKAQREFVAIVNNVLRKCGAELSETGEKDGYPTFDMAMLHGAHAKKAKQLLFASSVKPDLRFRDAVSNDIEIVTNADKVLSYDRPIGNKGLLWLDLQSWWRELTCAPDEDTAKRTLYRRLEESLPLTSPPQKAFFRAYYGSFRESVPGLPALLPEVWLHCRAIARSNR
jgi:hypothetical protein